MADHSNTSPSGDIFSEIPEYDAFISYKHGAIDSAAARALQKNLEHFRAPVLSGIRLPGTPFSGKEGRPKKTGRIRRVFLDDGELSACAAFGSHIREALKKSRWLIIICSPETKKSPWVNLEVETFLEYHDRNHILAVMTGGEPADIFPEAFAGSGSLPDEMLAADARGETVREVLKKLRGDALLRVAAPILGLAYDDLKQRSKIYKLQRLASAAVVCLAAVTCFSIYAVSKNRQLERSNTDLWLRQAQITAREAEDLLDQGDNLQAVQNLLSILPDGNEKAAGGRPDGLLLPSAQYLLARALNLYKPALMPNYGEDRLAASAVINNKKYLDADLVSSPDGSYLLAMSVIPGDDVIVWDTETCEQVCIIQFPENITNWSGEAVLDKSRIVLCGGHTAACFDYTTGEQLWKTTVLNTVCAAVYAPGKGFDAASSSDSSSGSSTDAAGSSDSSSGGSADAASSSDSSLTANTAEKQDRLFILTSTGVSILSTEDGTILSERKYVLEKVENDSKRHNSGEDSSDQKEQVSENQKEQVSDNPVNPLQDLQTDETEEAEKKSLLGTPVRAVLSSGGQYLVFSSKDEQSYEKYLFACDPETGETVQLDNEGFSEVYEIQSEILPAGKGEIIYYAGIRSRTDSERAYSLRAVALSSDARCKEKWRKEFPRSSVVSKGDTSYSATPAEKSVRILPGFQSEGSVPSLLFCCYAHIFKLNPSDGNILSDLELPSDMTDLLASAEYCSLFTSQGKIYAYDGQSLMWMTDAFQANCNDIAKMTGKQVFFCLLHNRKIVKYAPMETDDKYTPLSLDAYDDSDPDELLSSVSHTDPLFHSSDWLISADNDRIFWIRDSETTIHSMSLDQIVKTARPEISTSAETDEEDNVSSSLLTYNLKPLCLEGDTLHFIDFARRKLSDTDSDYVYFEYILNLSDGSLTSKVLFVSHEIFPAKKNLHYDHDRHILYLLQPHNEYTKLWSYTMDEGNITGSYRQGNIKYSSISPDGRKMLLLSEDDLKLNIIDLDSKKTVASVSLSEYTRRSIQLLRGSYADSMFCWDGNILVVNDYMRIHIYDRSGSEIRTVPCGKSVVDPTDYTYPVLSLSPDRKYLYYFVSGRLYQYDVSEGKIINEMEPGPESVSGTGWLCMFGGDDPKKKDHAQPSDVLHILKDNVLYTVRCDVDSFGLTSRIDNVFNYNPQTGKIYMSIYNYGKSNNENNEYFCLYYREYSLEDIIRFAKEAYGVDDQDTTGSDN